MDVRLFFHTQEVSNALHRVATDAAPIAHGVAVARVRHVCDLRITYVTSLFTDPLLLSLPFFCCCLRVVSSSVTSSLLLAMATSSTVACSYSSIFSGMRHAEEPCRNSSPSSTTTTTTTFVALSGSPARAARPRAEAPPPPQGPCSGVAKGVPGPGCPQFFTPF